MIASALLLAACAAATGGPRSASPDSFSRIAGRKISVLASRTVRVPVVESPAFPLAEFLARPASEFAAELQAQLGGTSDALGLDARQFDCSTPEVDFFGTRLQAVLVAQVTADEAGPVIEVCDATLRGSADLERLLQGAYAVASTNRLSCERGADRRVYLCTDASIELQSRVLELLPVPDQVLQQTGKVALDGLLSTLLPQALERIAGDYQRAISARRVRGYQKGCSGSPESAE
eukprot:5997454-Prymnesium_polylepis.1